MEVLRKGSKGPNVKVLLYQLNLLLDGIFGPITEEAVKQFQKEHGLTVDGIVGNSTWNKLQHLSRKIDTIILHCSATPEDKDFSIIDIKRWHLDRGFNDIGYHYIIYRSGYIANGRDINIVGAHCSGHNTGSIGICYIGGLDKTGKQAKDTRTDNLKKSLLTLVKQLMTKYNINMDNIYCHNQFAAKACPSFKIEDFKKELQNV